MGVVEAAAWTTGEIADRLAVAPAWVEVVVEAPAFPSPAAVDPPRWSPVEVIVWERRYRAALDGSRVRDIDLRMLALRLAGFPASAIAGRVGVHVQTVRTRLRDVGLRLALAPPRSGEGRSWPRVRAGYPPDTALPGATGQRVAALWRAGASWSAIAAATGYPPAQLKVRVARAGLDLPPRWYPPQVGDYLGRSRSHIYGRSRRMSMCPADGVDERGRRWWWPQTVTAWAAPLPRCPICGAKGGAARPAPPPACRHAGG
ncbi:MAG TPA: hypothetical protein VES95_13515, partial [Dermatophilaceae bacterium]|nr:hypothetical protein [Dermatophilaceae bacterium]